MCRKIKNYPQAHVTVTKGEDSRGCKSAVIGLMYVDLMTLCALVSIISETFIFQLQVCWHFKLYTLVFVSSSAEQPVFLFF